MTKSLLFVALLLPVLAMAQPEPPKNAAGEYEYSAVIPVDSATAAQLYGRAKLFIATAFKSSKEVVQMNDEGSKTVAGNGSDKINYKGLESQQQNYLHFKFVIQCKDGRYKYTISNFERESINAGGFTVPLEDEKAIKKFSTKGMRAQMMVQMDDDMKALIADLKKTMAAQTDLSKNW